MRAITSSIILALAVASTVDAAPSKKEAQPSKEQAQAVQPAALEALRRMSAFLGQQKNFSLRTEMETDYVIGDGQKVRLASRGDLRVQRPSQLRAHVVSDRKDREFFYDGRTFTIFSPKVGYYAQVSAPPTIRGLADQLQAQYGLELPLVDLFRWSESASFDQITSAKFIGTTELDGVKVDQFAFRQPGVDWQIWIDRGARPLPRKLLITTTDDPARPEHSIAMNWQLGTTFDNKTFAFVPPRDATRIGIAELGPPTQTARRAKRTAPVTKKREPT